MILFQKKNILRLKYIYIKLEDGLVIRKVIENENDDENKSSNN